MAKKKNKKTAVYKDRHSDGQRCAAALRDRPQVQGYSIDRPGTRNIDDAFMIRRHEDGSARVEISISDTPVLVLPGGDADAAARRLSCDVFHGQRKLIEMLPAPMVQEFLSLDMHSPKPAVTFTVDIDRDTHIIGIAVRRTAFRNKSRLTPDDVDYYMQQGNEEMRNWLDVAARLHTRRMKAQAALCDYNIPQTVPNGLMPRTALNALSGQGAGELLVQEMMYLAYEAATRYMHENDIDFVAQADKPVHSELHHWSRGNFAQNAHKIADSFSRKLLESSSHAKVTSPNRRYIDLMNMQMIAAHAAGEGAPYDRAYLRGQRAEQLRIHDAYNTIVSQKAADLNDMAALLMRGDLTALFKRAAAVMDDMRQDMADRMDARDVRNGPPRSPVYNDLKQQLEHAGARYPQFSVMSVRQSGTHFHVAIMETELRGARPVNVTAAAPSPAAAMDRAAAATLHHLARQRPRDFRPALS
jgi:hypothetical protein